MAQEVGMLEGGSVNRDYYVELSFVMRDGDHPADLEPVIEPVIEVLMGAFEGVTGISDVDLGFELATARLDISIYLRASSDGKALDQAATAARTALHAAGHATPGWEAAFKRMIETGQYQSVVRADDGLAAV